MINYPIKKENNLKTKVRNNASLGMALEEMINISNEYYKNQGFAYVNKRPTNIKVFKTDEHSKIIDGCFLSPSTLDYVGVYKGHYLDFEAKETTSTKGFMLMNIASHQIQAIQDIINNNGISFVIIFFKTKNEIYLIDGKKMIEFYQNFEKFVPYDTIKEFGYLVKEGYNIPCDYLKIVKELYFK